MKNLFLYLLTITFLFQSFYTYHNVDLGSQKLKTGSVYKIKLGGEESKIKLISSNDTLAKVKIGNAEKDFKISEIKSAKERKISSGKIAILLLPLILVGIGTIILPHGIHPVGR